MDNIQDEKIISNDAGFSIDDKIASIGDFIEKKEVVEEETTEQDENGVEESSSGVAGKFKELTPEELKEKIVKLVSEIASRDLSDEEKESFMENFKFWNGTMFELLDIGNHLKTIVGKTSFSLSPTHSLLAYLAGTGALVMLLRKDLQDKILNRNRDEVENRTPVKKKVETKTSQQNIIYNDEEEEASGIPKYAPEI